MANAQPAGMEGVVAGNSAISNVYGDEGRLIYRGYDIKDLAEHVSFEETVYLLWHGKLPNRAELDDLCEQLRNNREQILTLPDETILACGHGPLTTVGQEKKHNPFFTG